jgi:RHS repeat-associated protein
LLGLGVALTAIASAAAAAAGPMPASANVAGSADPAAPSNFGVFVEALVAAGPASAAERDQLREAVAAYRQDAERATGDPDAYGRVEPLLAYIAANPTSPWRVSLLTNIGLRFEQLGYVSRAIEFFEQAAAAVDASSTDAGDLAVAGQVDRLLAERLELHAWLGHVERASALLADPRLARLQGSANVKATEARLAFQQLQEDPAHAMRCGWVALAHLMRLRGADAAQLADLERQLAGPRGTSLAELADWARKAGAGLEAVHLEANQPIPAGALVHMKSGHFATIAEARGEGLGRQLRVLDPVLGNERWISARAMAAEASGYYLVDAKAASAYTLASADEVRGVIGAGNPGKYLNTATSTKDNQSAGPCAGQAAGKNGIDAGAETQGSGPPASSGDGSACDACSAPACASAHAMPQYSVQSLNIGLAIHDTPLGYAPAIGPQIDFSVFYSQNEAYQPATFTFSNLGQKWTHNWLAYITDDPTQAGQNVSLYERGGGTMLYTGYNAGDGTFTREPRSPQLVLVSTNPVTYERRFGDGSKEVYAQSDGTQVAGRHVFLTQVVDSTGNTVTLAYDSLMRLQTITDAAGNPPTQLGYGSATSLVITSVTDPFGRQAVFGYDGSGRLNAITDVLPMSSSFGYDANGNVKSMTTPYGKTSFAFTVVSPRSRWIEITDPLGFTERVEYESTGGNGISYTGPTPTGMKVGTADLNYRDTFYFDKVAYTQARKPDGTFDYNQATLIQHWAETNPGAAVVAPVLLATRHPMNSNTEWEWYLYPDMIGSDGTYSPKTVTDIWTMTQSGRVLPDGTSRVTGVTYNPLGQVTTRTDPVGRTTTYAFDPSNNTDLLKVTQSDSAGDSEVVYKASNYNAAHEPQTVTDASGQQTTYTYNKFGQVLTVTNALGQVTTYNYNSSHQLLNIVDANGQTFLKFAYDTFGRVHTVTDSETYTRTIGYDNLNRVTSITYPDGTSDVTNYDRLDIGSTVDRLNHQTTLVHDANRRLKKVTDANGVVTQYGYDNAGRMTSFQDGRNNTTTWQIDAEGRVATKSYPSGQGYTLVYDSAGRESTRTDTVGQTRTITYYADDTLKKLSYSANNTDPQNFKYDALYPRVVQVVDQASQAQTNFAYVPAGTNGAGRLQSETYSAPQALPISYAYDELGRVSTRIVGSFNENWRYDKLGRVKADINALGEFDYTYLGETSQPQTEALANAKWATQWTWANNLNDRMLHGITHTLSPGSAAARMNWLQQLAIWMGWSSGDSSPAAAPLAAADSISYTTQTGQITGRTEGLDTWSYGYDATDRLISAPYGGSGAGQGAQYTYNASDFLSQIATTNPATTTNYMPNADNQVVSETTGTANINWISDQNGNVTDDGVNTYLWDAENRVLKITRKSDGHLSSFSYDGLGRRAVISERDVGGNTSSTFLAWCQGSATPCGASQGSNSTAYLSQGEYSTATSPAAIYYARDHLGSVMQAADSAGNVLATRSYGDYGRMYNASGTPSPTVGYAGMYMHAATGLYLTPARVYDPRDGRWLTRDPAGEAGGKNLYEYAGGDPAEMTDPFGLAPDWWPISSGSKEVCVAACTAGGAVLGGVTGTVVGGTIGAAGGAAAGTLAAPGVGSVAGGVAGAAAGGDVGGNLGAAGGAGLGYAFGQLMCSGKSKQKCLDDCYAAYLNQVSICKMAPTAKARAQCYSRASDLHGECRARCK